jgi:Rad3-related DNA helicase
MIFDLDKRTAALGVGEFSGFALGPREAGEGGGAGIWRAQLGTHWHNELRARATAEHGSAAEFEVPINGQIVHRGWTLSLTGRIDQIVHATTEPDARWELADDTTRTTRAIKGRASRPSAKPTVLREIKSVIRALPADEVELRRDYPEYFIQLASYVVLARNGLVRRNAPAAESTPPESTTLATAVRGELVFVETTAGLAQTIPFTPADDALFKAQLDRIADFLDLRLRARERLRGLRYRPAFAQPRPGQETTLVELTRTFEQRPLVLFEAPTGFGKTGVLLEFALGQLKSGHFDRALYLTSKSTGQLQVVRTLGTMTAPEPTPLESSMLQVAGLQVSQPANLQLSNLQPAPTPVAVWHVRNKAEHCVNTTFHCVRDNCRYLAGAAERWPKSGLARFYLDERHARDLDTLRAAGRDARICPYEITRAALAFNDVWIGDYNYVFAPRNRGLFYDQPGFNAARTLLLIDEAHNLPGRVADAFSHEFSATDAYGVREELNRIRPPASLVTAWDHWCHFLHHLKHAETLSAADEDDARHLLGEIAKQVSTQTLDYAALGPYAADALWQVPALLEELGTVDLPMLWWCPREATLALTCLDAAKAIGATLREYGGVVLASATLTPLDGFVTACGLDASSRPDAEIRARSRAAPSPATATVDAPERLGNLNKRDTKKLYKQLTSAAELLRVEEARDAAAPALLRAHAPWREGTYDIAFDSRVDTTFQHRSRYFPTTATTVTALRVAAGGPVAVFFPSYAYADAIKQELTRLDPAFRVALQPKVRDLAAQTSWVEESLLSSDALFLVLGSSFAESIDVLGGRITHAMIVGPALPEVNAVQRARLADAAQRGLSREAAFRLVYQTPGMTKVNQALGRLVRAPGHHAKVLLHCRRFSEASYRDLLAPEYRDGQPLVDDSAFEQWLKR